MTVGEMMRSVEKWLRENEDADLLMEAISDSIVSLWESIVLVNLSQLLGGPATATFTAAGQGSTAVVSVADPVIGPVVAAIVQGALGNHTPSVQFTLVTDSGSETLPSPPTLLLIPANSIAQVTPPAAVSNSVGWNCYFDGVKQNGAVIPFGVNWVEPEGGAVQGAANLPVENTTADDIWYIENLTVETPNGTKTWNQTEVGSELWRKMAGGKASSSPFQAYVYDFDGRNIQVRPFTGSGLSPSYFYVRRPRHVTDPSSLVPFREPGAELFIRYNSLSLLHLSNHEYPAATAWDGKAEQQRTSIMSSLTRKNRKKDLRIQPLFR